MKTEDAAAALAHALISGEPNPPAEAITALLANGIIALERIADAAEKIAARMPVKTGDGQAGA